MSRMKTEPAERTRAGAPRPPRQPVPRVLVVLPAVSLLVLLVVPLVAVIAAYGSIGALLVKRRQFEPRQWWISFSACLLVGLVSLAFNILVLSTD